MSASTSPQHSLRYLPGPLADRGPYPFSPAEVARAVLVADDGLFEAITARHGRDCLSSAGVWALARHPEWGPQTGAPAAALRDLLGTVRHPHVRSAVAALSEGIALSSPPLAADQAA